MTLIDRVLASLRWEEDRVSDRWLQEQKRRSSRIHFEGVAWRWPINKLADQPKFWRRRRTQAA